MWHVLRSSDQHQDTSWYVKISQVFAKRIPQGTCIHEVQNAMRLHKRPENWIIQSDTSLNGKDRTAFSVMQCHCYLFPVISHVSLSLVSSYFTCVFVTCLPGKYYGCLAATLVCDRLTPRVAVCRCMRPFAQKIVLLVSGLP